MDSAAGTVLNAINGVLLSYRFGLTGNQEQFGYLRSVAVEMLVKAVDESILGCEDPDAKLMELEALICLKVRNGSALRNVFRCWSLQVQEKKIAVQAVVSSTPLFTLGEYGMP